jgi:methionine transaminase
MRSKLPSTGTTIFSVMSALAAEYKAINLGQGFPGFPVDPLLIDGVAKAMRDGHNQYAPMPGLPSLREKLAEKINRSYHRTVNPATEITVTAGATQAIFTALSAFIHPGDEVILFAPAYDCYAPAISLNGGVPVWISLDWPDFRIPWDEVERKISSRTRMILFNTPSNPSATLWKSSDMLKLLTLTAETNILLLSDEVYEHIVFDGQPHESVLKYPELAERSISVYSFGKTFHATGWKTGYAIAPEKLMTEFRKVHQYNVFSCNTPIQHALTSYLDDAAHYDELGAFYQRKRDLFLSCLSDSAFAWKPAQGTYFQLLNYSGITDAPDRSIAEQWTREIGVASIPVSCFYPDEKDQHVLRFCFAKEDHELEEAAKRLNQLS